LVHTIHVKWFLHKERQNIIILFLRPNKKMYYKNVEGGQAEDIEEKCT